VWNLRFDHEIHLQNDFPSGRTRLQRVKAPIPGPEIDPLPSIRRARSQWELVDSDENILPSIVVRVEPQTCFLSNKQSKNLPFKTRPLEIPCYAKILSTGRASGKNKVLLRELVTLSSSGSIYGSARNWPIGCSKKSCRCKVMPLYQKHHAALSIPNRKSLQIN